MLVWLLLWNTIEETLMSQTDFAFYLVMASKTTMGNQAMKKRNRKYRKWKNIKAKWNLTRSLRRSIQIDLIVILPSNSFIPYFKYQVGGFWKICSACKIFMQRWSSSVYYIKKVWYRIECFISHSYVWVHCIEIVGEIIIFSSSQSTRRCEIRYVQCPRKKTFQYDGPRNGIRDNE